MAEKRTDACRLKSKAGGGWLTSEQYVAEQACLRQAKSQGLDLPHKFWAEDGEWKKAFLRNLAFARRLTKKHGEQAVLRALESPQGKRAYSLTAKWFVAIVEAEAAAPRAVPTTPEEVTTAEPTPEKNVFSVRPQPAGTASLLSKLKALE